MGHAMKALASLAFAMLVMVGVAPAGDVQVQMLTNRTHGYEIGYPSDWKAGQPDGLDYAFLSHDNSTLCFAQGQEIPELAKISNADLQRELSQPLGEQFWNDIFFSEIPGTRYLNVTAMTDHPGKWPVQIVIATAMPVIDGKAEDTTFVGMATFKSGTSYLVMCMAPTAQFKANTDGIGAILSTFRIFK